MADDLPTSARIIAPTYVPVLNHSVLTLADGRVLAAGGMATSNVFFDIEIGGASQLLDPQTRQWEVLGNDLSFDFNQRVYLNQMGDGRVLFFATREGGDTPEYQARIWNPKSGAVEKPAVTAKPKPDTDIAVLPDGRVLIVSGNEGNADIWDSRTDTVAHSEEPILKESRWRTMPLDNRQVLLIETFPVDLAATGRNVAQSVVLLWDQANGEWRQLADLPTLFTDNSRLAALPDGSVQAIVGEETFRLHAPDGSWESQTVVTQPAPKAEAAAGQTVTTQPPKIPPPAKHAAAVAAEPSWWVAYTENVGRDLQWMILFFPLLLLTIHVLARQDNLPYMIWSAAKSLQISLAAVFFAALAWVLLRHAPLEILRPKLLLWWEYYRDDIAAILTALAVFGPILLYFILRRMEAEKLARFLKNASKVARTILIAIIAFLFAGSITADYSERAQGSDHVPDEISWTLLAAAIGDHKWLLLAVLGPFSLYMLLSRFEKRKLDRITTYANRTFLVGVIGLIVCGILAAVYFRGQNQLAENVRYCRRPATLSGIRQWTECVEAGNGTLESALFQKTKEIALSLPSVPCRYIGVWSSTRQGSKYKVTLTDDSRFIAEPMHDSAGRTSSITGFWGVHDDVMVWFEDKSIAWPIDASTLLPENRSRFSLIEMNGERAAFELIDAIKSNTCSL